MDSPLVSRLFRQLFQHRACPSRQNLLALSSTLRRARQLQPPYSNHARHQARLYSAHRGKPSPQSEANWQQRTDILPPDMTEEFMKYPLVTAADLRTSRHRPRRVKMLMRDFVEDSLYNPHYGYFSKQVVIFSPGDIPFDFPSIPDEPAFHSLLSSRFSEFEDALDLKEFGEGQKSDTRQLWYTPTELFRPHYGEAIARYLIANYVLTDYPYHDLNIYEMGAGRGTLMLNILDYIRATEPDVYARTQFKIIEISSALAQLQTSNLMRTIESRGHAGRVEIINHSIFDWDTPVPSPCFFLAFEVFDNFAHDAIRYDLATEQPLQCTVLIDSGGDFYEFYDPHLDDVAWRFFRTREVATQGRHPRPYPSSRAVRALQGMMPFAPNLSAPEYVPTRLMQFFQVLERYFPAHRLVTSDFHSLPDTIKGLNAPVVQTRFQRRPVPVTTPLVHQGYFDIMFPTNFEMVESMYQAITGKHSQVLLHEDFMRRWACVEDTATASGENPLLSWYRNASVMITV